MSTPVRSTRQSSAEVGISIFSYTSNCLASMRGSKRWCTARHISLSSQEYSAARATSTWAKGIWLAPLPHKSS